MRLLYTITSYPPAIGGAQFYAHSLVTHLQQNHTTQVISLWDMNRTDWLLGTTIRANKQSQNYTIDNVPVYRLGLSNWDKIKLLPAVVLYYPLMNLSIKPIADVFATQMMEYAQHADLIHNTRVGREGLSFASLKLARKFDIPFIFSPLHHPRWVGWPYLEYLKLYRLADLVIALTKTEKQILIEQGVDERKIAVTGMGPILSSRAYPEEFLIEYAINGPMILFLGQHYQYKGYSQLLQATKFVWEKVPDANFVFIGPPVKNIEKEFAAFNDKRIYRLGKVDLQTKTNALAACTLLCVPSMQESFGGVYTEAWSFAKPVIGGNIPAIAEVITDGEDGFLVQQEPREIADRICYLLLHSEEARSMGIKGEQKVQHKYSWAKLAKLTEKAYHATL